MLPDSQYPHCIVDFLDTKSAICDYLNIDLTLLVSI